MTNQEIEKLVDKLYNKFRGIPGVDQELIRKCLTGIAALDDQEVETKLLRLANFL